MDAFKSWKWKARNRDATGAPEAVNPSSRTKTGTGVKTHANWRRNSDDLAENVHQSTSTGLRPSQNVKYRRPEDTQPTGKSTPDDALRDGKRQETRYPIGFKFLEATAEIVNPDDALNEIMSRKPQLSLFLASSYSLNDCDKYIILMKILDKVGKSSFSQMKSQLLLETAKSKLSENLQLYLTKLPYQSDWEKTRNRCFWNDPMEFWNSFLGYFESVHTLSPYYAFEKCRPVMDVATALCLPMLDEKHGFVLSEDCAQRFETVKQKISVRETQSMMKEKKQKKRVDYGPAPENFRELNVFPSEEDLLEPNPYVRPNIIDGSYESIEHYLDVQFRLLREDCYGPLRIGLQQFRKDMTKKRYDNIRVHRNIVVTEPIMTHNQFGVVVKWDTSKEKYSQNIDWAQSKRFMFGSLLLFVKDDFREILVGTVLDRDKKYLTKGLVVVQLYRADLLEKKLFKTQYHMLECQVYFEPYLHVLKALQDPEFSKHLPMRKYIVSVDHVPTPPAYLTKNTAINVLTSEGVVKRFKVLDDAAWPKPHEIALDESQYEAYKSALTQEFVVIQGPPGTGKTYLGARIAETLLKNRSSIQNAQVQEQLLARKKIADPYDIDIHCIETEISATLLRSNLNERAVSNCTPHFTGRLLVLCYTNHALDQFLENILRTTQSVIRIGGQSKNKNLNQFNLTLKRAELIAFLSRKPEEDYVDNFYEWDDFDYEIFEARRKRIIAEKYWETHRHMAERYLATYRNVRNDLEDANTRLAVCQKKINIFNEGVYSFESVKGHCSEAAALENYKDVKEDPLLFWLFENVEITGTEFHPKLFVHKAEENDTELEDDLQFNLDDIGMNDHLKWSFDNKIGIRSSFLVSDEIYELEKLYKKYDDVKTKKVPIFDVEHKMKCIQSRLLFFQSIIKNRDRLKKVNIFDKENLSDFTTEERWKIYFDWAYTIKQVLLGTFRSLKNQQKYCYRGYEESRMIIDLFILRDAQVVGVTTTGAARIRKLLQALDAPIVIVEEAAEVMEAHIISALTKNCQHLIMIGDHQQLRPSAAHYKLARHFNIEVSLFERMVKTGARASRLRLQHRMRPEIAALISPAIYPDLQNHSTVLSYPPVRGITTSLYFFSHDNREEDDDEMLSHRNCYEADMILKLANYLMKQGYESEDITILATYSSQMVYLQGGRSEYPFLSNVKITVVDNYQGEESKIILLSLVRNNDEGSVGFLATDNRVCVALSRAKEGLYIMGNIDMLKNKSELWTKIASTLEAKGSLGNSFVVKCQHHPDYKTEIRGPDDFLKVPEGGCLRKCEALLECGHCCPLVCHSYDEEHIFIECNEKCNRILCSSGHVCPEMCGDDCGQCKVIVEKEMPCGHTIEVLCYMEPDNENVKCCVEVTVTLPACGHEARKPCYVNLNDAQCPIKCEERLQCGHTCRNNCHKNKDPYHEDYECKADCARTKSGCSVIFADDDEVGEHKCVKMCYEECDPCLVTVTKKRSKCTHRDIIECSKDLDLTLCMKKCSRALPCKHFCKNKCFEPCTPNCMQLTTKTIAECGHKVKVPCSISPTREPCVQNCEKVLACGHICIMKCAQECDCDRKMDSSMMTLLCGHTTVSCHLYLKGLKAPESVQLLSECEAPCEAELTCGHPCAGTCGRCRQGRLHAPCGQPCGRTLICGHLCEEMCNTGCSPCDKPCEVACEHNRCPEKCGLPCVVCKEPCGRVCPHGSCQRKCGAPCDREPCNERCPLTLPCGHPCRGLCGEVCPPLCAVCSPDDFPTPLLGDSYEDDDLFIVLKDCGHTMAVTEADMMMQSKPDGEVHVRHCPTCRKPIINTSRYKDIVNDLFKNEINPIKKQLYGDETSLNKKRKTVEMEFSRMARKAKAQGGSSHSGNEALKHCLTILTYLRNNKRLSMPQIEALSIVIEKFDVIYGYMEKFETRNLTGFRNYFSEVADILLGTMAEDLKTISEQRQQDVNNEIKRLRCILQLATLNSDWNELSSEKIEELTSTHDCAVEAVTTWRTFDETVAVEALKTCETALKKSGIVLMEERELVVKAIGLSRGHWYKCPNGHFYCIGDCGGAMERGRCPDCGATVGGENHRLVEDNQKALEMDNSIAPTYY